MKSECAGAPVPITELNTRISSEQAHSVSSVSNCRRVSAPLRKWHQMLRLMVHKTLPPRVGKLCVFVPAAEPSPPLAPAQIGAYGLRHGRLRMHCLCGSHCITCAPDLNLSPQAVDVVQRRAAAAAGAAGRPGTGGGHHCGIAQLASARLRGERRLRRLWRDRQHAGRHKVPQRAALRLQRVL